MDLRSTLNLPNADATIPMKAGLAAMEPALLTRWQNESLYHRIQALRSGDPVFVLHDGPPYTNSPIHLGTALNKMLKDFVLKSRTMMGFRCPYVPGFDNHGLPIEQAVMRKFAEKRQSPGIVELRQACREHAQEYVAIQSQQFQRLGVFGLWENPYRTMDFRFEAEILRVFRRLVEGGYVYRGLRPTLWSPTSRTALADTEIVYHPHTSTAIYVAFPLHRDPNQLLVDFPGVAAVIWTTTPWTIPANFACAFHPELDYAVVRVHLDDDSVRYYVLLSALVERTAQAVGWKRFDIVRTLGGINFEGMHFRHPVFERDSIAVMANYVTTEDGTGIVHTAPSHGRDDFYTGQKYGLPVPVTVDERGFLTAETGEFAGTYYKDCDTVVVDRLRDVGALLHAEPYEHSYPYAERDDQPVIFRATEQWFVAVEPLRAQMLEQIQPVPLEERRSLLWQLIYPSEGEPQEIPDVQGATWVPESGYNRIEAMVRNRPDWCISRQRPWGVGIPVFYGDDSGQPVLVPEVIDRVADLVAEHGSDIWFEWPAERLLPEGFRHPATGETTFTKETDVLDVWFDSGSTSLCVLEGNVYPEWKEHWPADLYFEGSDQHRGWFNSSLVIGVGCRGNAPYRQVVTHGFVTDEKGQKQSKRLGNVIEPVKAASDHGADVLRYWCAAVDYAQDMPCTEAILRQFGENYRNIRNTLRFLLSNLGDFGPEESREPTEDLDQWAVEQTDLLARDVVDAYARYDFNQAIVAIHNFCGNELSRFYLDVIKDRMYCDAADSKRRRSAQAGSLAILDRLVRLCAPVLAFTAEEVWDKMRENGLHANPESIHAERFLVPGPERLDEIEGSERSVRFAKLLTLRSQVFAEFEAWKATGGIKDSQDALATIAMAEPADFSDEDYALYLKFSGVTITPGEGSVVFAASPYAKCERSRLRRPDVQGVDIEGRLIALSLRDRQVLGHA
jgi:isoleucyl-tRNA synthetase